MTRLRQGFGGHAKKQVLRALVVALVLPGGLIAMVAVSLLAGLYLILALYVAFLRAAWGYVRELRREAHETQARQVQPPTLPPDVRIPEGPRYWSARGSSWRN